MRSSTRRTWTIAAAFVVLALFAGRSPLLAQTPAPAPAPPDFSKVEIKTTKMAGNFYTLDGQGGTIGVLAGPDGVLMVDSQFAPLTDKIVAAIKQISDGPIRFMINTHVHADHTGGNENLGKMGVAILARDQLRARLARAGPRRRRRVAAGHHLSRRHDVSHERRGRELIPVPARTPTATRGDVPQRQRAYDRRLLPFARLSQHRSRQRRIAERHARGVRSDHQSRQADDEDCSRPWRHRRQDCASPHIATW